jgi:uncharacterized membrane protein
VGLVVAKLWLGLQAHLLRESGVPAFPFSHFFFLFSFSSLAFFFLSSLLFSFSFWAAGLGCWAGPLGMAAGPLGRLSSGPLVGPSCGISKDPEKEKARHI